jgi:hypothetical protein
MYLKNKIKKVLGHAYEPIFISKVKPGKEFDTCKKKWIQEMKIRVNINSLFVRHIKLLANLSR